jgi:phosphodiesterase/alkaline phosphatase D-like protein
VRGPQALEATDHTARIDLTGLPAGQDIFYACASVVFRSVWNLSRC